MDMEALKAAVAGAQQVQAPAASPNSTGANAFAQAAIGHIQNLASTNFQLGASGAASDQLTGAVNQNADATAASEKQARDAEAARRKKEMQDLQDQIDNYSDPKKYVQQINDKGGYDFFAPDGTPISARDYAKVQNKHLTDILKGSQDTTDQEFVQNYNDIQKIGQIVQSGDKAAYKKYLSKDPGLEKRMKDNNITNYSGLVKSFRASYPQYFSDSSAQDVGNASYGSTPLQDNRSTLDKLKGALHLAPAYKGF